HAGHGVVPEVLLIALASFVDVVAGRIGAYDIAGMTAADPGGLHPAAGRKIGRAQAHALHPGTGGGDLFDAIHSRGRLQQRVNQDGPVQAGAGFKLGKETVDVVNVFGAFNLGHHDDVDFVADFGDQREEVVENP